MLRFRDFGNFTDPWGLMARMLRSGDSAAFSSLGRAAVELGTGPVDWMLESRERRLTSDAVGPTQPLLLVVGGARTGSTMIYQLLASALNVSYLTNGAAVFPRAPITATKSLAHGWDRDDRRLHSYYGQTAGWSAPNDGFFLWNRWFGSDRYAVDTTAFDDAAKGELTRFFGAWTREFPMPFLNKNNRNTSVVAALADLLPSALFVAVRRDPFYVAQSLVVARTTVQGDPREAWGLHGRPAESRDRHGDRLGYLDDVSDQVHRADAELDEQLAAVDPDRWVELSYEEVCVDAKAAVARVAELSPALTWRTGSVPAPRSDGNVDRLAPAELERLRVSLRQRYGSGAS